MTDLFVALLAPRSGGQEPTSRLRSSGASISVISERKEIEVNSYLVKTILPGFRIPQGSNISFSLANKG